MELYKICPYCGGTLDSGWIQSRDGLHWTPGKVFAAVLSGWAKGAIRLENRKNQNHSAAHAYRCSNCKLVIVPYDRFDLGDE